MQCRKCREQLPEGAAFCPSCGTKQQTASKKHLKRPNGFGTIYKLSGRRRKPWAIRKDGQYLGAYETRTAALEALDKMAGTPVRDTYNYTFADVFKAWKPEHFPELTDAGRTQYEHDFDTIFKELHDRKFRELRTADFQAILDRYADRSVSTVNKYKQLLTQMGKWAMREEIVTANFASFCKLHGRASKAQEPMTDEEISRIEKAAETNEAAKIVCMLLSTGMRIGELFRLPLADYHGDYVVGGEKTKAGRDRIIPIREEGRPHFEYFARQSEGMELLLDSYAGNRDLANFRKRDYARLLDELKIPRSKSPRSTRTTYGTRAVAENLAPAVLQKVMGHKDFSTTQKHYNRPDAAVLVKAVSRARKQASEAAENAEPAQENTENIG